MKKEAISHNILDDLNARNENWDKLDGVPEKVDNPNVIDYMFNQAVDKVYETCERNVTTRTNAIGTQLNSGQTFVNDVIDNVATLQYDPQGYLYAEGVRRAMSPIVIDGYTTAQPYLEIRVAPMLYTVDKREYYIKYIDSNNYLSVKIGSHNQIASVHACAAGVVTELATQSEPSTDPLQRDGLTSYELKIRYVKVHKNFAEGERKIEITLNGQLIMNVPLSLELGTLFNGSHKLGFNANVATAILGIKAGSVVFR